MKSIKKINSEKGIVYERLGENNTNAKKNDNPNNPKNTLDSRSYVDVAKRMFGHGKEEYLFVVYEHGTIVLPSPVSKFRGLSDEKIMEITNFYLAMDGDRNPDGTEMVPEAEKNLFYAMKHPLFKHDDVYFVSYKNAQFLGNLVINEDVAEEEGASVLAYQFKEIDKRNKRVVFVGKLFKQIGVVGI